MYSTEVRCRYRNNQLGEVICQLRFPEILTVNTTLPDRFQETIRGDYPQYSRRVEKLPGEADPQSTVNNYQFSTADGAWRVNLTSRFISLVCSRYTCWEDFAEHLDKPLAAFIRLYKPAYFERIGLRYLNFISRKSLELEGIPFSRLITPCYLGLLADEEVAEANCSRATVDMDMAIRGGCRLKLHAGPGQVRCGNQTDSEIKFIFDQDLFMPGKLAPNLTAPALQTLHSQAFSIFRGAITDQLHNAMEPEDI